YYSPNPSPTPSNSLFQILSRILTMRAVRRQNNGRSSYKDSSFLGLQYALDKAFIKMSNIDTSRYMLTLQEFPYPPYHDDNFVELFSYLLPFCTVLSFVLLCPSVLKRVVEEKQSGVKELMKMMGLKSWMLWVGWMINAMLVCTLSVSIITFLLKTPFGKVGVLHHSDGFLIWIFLMFYCIAGITFCFAVSSLFSRPTLAMSCGVLLWFLSYSVPFSIIMKPGYIPVPLKLLSALLPNMAVSWGYRMMISYETNYVGLQWENLFRPPSGVRGDLSVGLMWFMLIVDIFVYSILTWYIDSVRPGQYGIAKPWYFICMPSYWRSSKIDDQSFTEIDDVTMNKRFEKPPNNLNVGIKIKNLRKVFHSFGGLNKKLAVDGVTLDIYNGEITALLGHNGAGKTTTMSILTGMFSPTSGSVHINGYDISTNIDEVRESLGLCPQHNLLFTELTVMEHLVFFAMLKGCSKDEATREAGELIGRLNLTEKRNQMSTTLSGGMKRKLSLGIALIGHTRVLMLDEPTSGMDPEARREIWDLLLGMRGERTILITTHFMEEADVLGDRIAIMDHGRVQCYGTSLFLKKLYGTGYQLNLLKQEDCIVSQITETIKLHIPDAEVKSEMGSVLTYSLPSEQTSKFPQLFERVEKNKEMLNIASIGVSITTLEEVFLKVGKEAEDELDGPINSDASIDYVKLHGSSEALTFKRTIGTILLIQRLTALLKKRIIFTYRKWFAFLYQAVLPIIMAILTMTLSSSSTFHSEPARIFNLSDYGSTNVLYSVNPNLEEWSKSYINVINATESDIIKVDEVSTSLLDIGENNIQDYRGKYIVAAEFNSSTKPLLNAMFSSVAIHSAPISLNLMTNTILKKESPEKSITAINHPFGMKDMEGPGQVMVTRILIMMMWMTLMPFGLLFLTASFLNFPLVERVSKAKQLQLMTGTSPFAYWFTCFLWDLFLYLVVATIMVIIVSIADPLDIFTGSEELGVYTLLLVMYGLSAIPFAYFFSYVRNTTASSFALVLILNTLIGLILSLVVYFMMFSDYYKPTAQILKSIFELIPHFTITYAFTRYSSQVLTNNYCKMQKSICNTTRVGCEVLYMAIDSLIYFGLICLIEFGLFGILFENIKQITYNFISNYFPGNEETVQAIDDDVIQEQDRFGTIIHSSDDILLVHNLVKKYSRTFTAVKGISFGVGSGECFGLLGVNGAGKTTTFKMLTGDEIPTDGVRIFTTHLIFVDFQFLGQIGYCPQFDAINESLTGYEMLSLFANLRGVPDVSVNHEVNKWLSLMGLNEYKNRQCGTYSGGNKRKLSTAMSLIGDPPIVFLDEPTSGVDPVARRNLWTVLTNIQKSGQSVVLTSH
ncbi:hypothetical protein L9F63_013335, partial [Diploptera punctata]